MSDRLSGRNSSPILGCTEYMGRVERAPTCESGRRSCNRTSVQAAERWQRCPAGGATSGTSGCRTAPKSNQASDWQAHVQYSEYATTLHSPITNSTSLLPEFRKGECKR